MQECCFVRRDGLCNDLRQSGGQLSRAPEAGKPRYDAANLTADGSLGMTYDAENRMTATAGVSYSYDGDGRRVRKKIGSTLTEFVYDVAGSVAAERESTDGGTNWTWTKGYVYLEGQMLVQYNGALGAPGATTLFAHKDHLGSTRLLTKPDKSYDPGDVYDYLPFGESSSSGSTTHKFTGKERDTESGLDYFGLRHMASGYGRFMSPDSIANDWELRNPQTWNRYTYARNNPLIYIDPDGAAVELIGKTEEERKRALEEIKKGLNKDAASRVYINEVKDGDKTRYFVGIQGDVGEFMKMGQTAHDLANLVEHKQVVEFAVTNDDLSRFGGAVTYDKGEVGNQNVRVLVNPDQALTIDNNQRGSLLRDWKYDGQNVRPRWFIQPMRGQVAAWHEFGHAWGYINGRPGPRSNQESIDWENRMRQQIYGPIGPNNAPRRAH